MACPENIDPVGYIEYLENKVIDLTIKTRDIKSARVQAVTRDENARASKESNLRKELNIAINNNAMKKKRIIELENTNKKLMKNYNKIDHNIKPNEIIRWQKDVIEILLANGRKWFDEYDLAPGASQEIKALDAWLRSML